MSSIVNTIYESLEEEQDERTRHLLGVGGVGPFAILLLISSYITFAKRVGPAYMDNKLPLNEQYPRFMFYGMLLYNISLALFNFSAFLVALMRCNYGLRFLDFKYPDRNDYLVVTILEIHLGYIYWGSKFADLFDTVLFIMRKKHKQVTFLHLYHHTVVPLFGWLFLKINPIVPAVHLFAIINSFIHVVMYTYYGLAAFGPEIQKYLWWKRYITVLQLWQFVFGMFYGFLMLLFQEGYPPVLFWFGMTQPPLFFYLFYDFYSNAYNKQKDH